MWTAEVLGFSFFELYYFFMIYSFLGWSMESIFVSVHQRHWVNRGFINGPFCPIYGTGAVLMIVCLTPIQKNIPLLFLGGLFVATVIEYVIAAVLESLFHASWWSYDDKKFNIKGRVCLVRSIQWGCLSVVMIHVLQPLVAKLVSHIPLIFGEVVGTVLLVYLMVDAGITIQQILHLNEKLKQLSLTKSELRVKLEHTKLYTVKKELVEYFEQKPMGEFLKAWKTCMEEELTKLEQMQKQEQFRAEYIWNEIREHIETQIQQLEIHSKIQKRLLDAFPGLHSHEFDTQLQELRMRMKEQKWKHKK